MTVKVAGIVAVELSSTCTVSLEPIQKHCTGLSGELPLMITVVPTDSVVTCGSLRTGGGQSCATIPAQTDDQTTSVTCLLAYMLSYLCTCTALREREPGSSVIECVWD